MTRTAYFDLHRMLRHLDPDDMSKLWAEFGPENITRAEPARVDALRSMMPSVLRRVLSREEVPIADRLVRVVGLVASAALIRPLLAVLVVAPDVSVRSETVEEALVSIGPDAVEPLAEALQGLASFSHTPVRVVASLAGVLGRLGDRRAIGAIERSLQAGAHGQWALLEALRMLAGGADAGDSVVEFVTRQAHNRQHSIEKGLWPQHGRKGISPLRVKLLQARYVRALRRWRLDGANG